MKMASFDLRLATMLATSFEDISTVSMPIGCAQPLADTAARPMANFVKGDTLSI
ncbi:MAG TPA: hypothetical protein VM940_11560 [Chthoniobacterales bacterium]|nr:hypothetical protein [Chthoniobacterales bacterium]